MNRRFMASIVTVLLLAGIGAMPASAQSSRGDVKTTKTSDSNSYHTWLEKQIRHELLMLPTTGCTTTWSSGSMASVSHC